MKKEYIKVGVLCILFLVSTIFVYSSQIEGNIINSQDGGILIENDNYLIDWDLETTGYSPIDGTFNLEGRMISKTQDKTVDVVLISPVQLQAGSRAYLTREEVVVNKKVNSFFCNSPIFGWFNQLTNQIFCTISEEVIVFNETTLINDTFLQNRTDIINMTSEYWFNIQAENATANWNVTVNISNVREIDITSQFEYYHIDELKQLFNVFNWSAVEPFGSYFYVVKDATFKQGKDYKFNFKVKVDKQDLPVKYSIAFIDRANDKYFILDPVMALAQTWTTQEEFENNTLLQNLTAVNDDLRLDRLYSTLNNNILSYFTLDTDAVTDAVGNITPIRWGMTHNTTADVISGHMVLSGTNEGFQISTGGTALFKNTTESRSVALWVKFESLPDAVAVFRDRTSSGIWQIREDQSRANVLGCSGWTGAAYVWADYGNPSLGAWHHLACVYDGELNIFQAFLDGVNTGNSSAITVIQAPSPSNASFGFDESFNYDLPGAIDEPAIWRRALTGAEVAELYASGAPDATLQYPIGNYYSSGLYSDRQNWTSESSYVITNISISLTNTSTGGAYFRYSASNASLDTATWERLPLNGVNNINLTLLSTDSIFYQFLINDTAKSTPQITSYTMSQAAVTNVEPTITYTNFTSSLGFNTSGENLTVAWNFTDADGDAQASYETKWYNSTYEIAAAVNNTILDSSYTVKGETYKAGVRVNDGTAWSVWYNTSTMTLVNGWPTPVLNSPDNATRTTGNSVVLNATCIDPDGETAYYAFYGNTTSPPATLLQNTTDSTFTWPTTDGQTYYWNVTCSDGIGDASTPVTETDTFTRADNGNVSANYAGNIMYYETPQTAPTYAYSNEQYVGIGGNKLNVTVNGATNYDGPGVVGKFSNIKNLTTYSDGNISTTFRIVYAPGNNRYSGHITFGQNLEHLDTEQPAPSKTAWYFRRNNEAGGYIGKIYSYVYFSGGSSVIYMSNCNGGANQTSYTWLNKDIRLDIQFDVANNATKWWVNGTYVGEATECNIDIDDEYSSATQVDSFGINMFDNELDFSATFQMYNFTVNGVTTTTQDGTGPSSEIRTFTENTMPVSVSNISSSDSSNKTTADLIGGYSYSDGDSDALVAFETRWYKDSLEQTALKNVTLVASGNTTKNEVWMFSSRVTDGYEWTAWSNSTTLTILDTLFTVTNPTIVSNYHGNYTNNNIYGSYVYTDADTGDIDSSYIDWYVDGSLVSSIRANQTNALQNITIVRYATEYGNVSNPTLHNWGSALYPKGNVNKSFDGDWATDTQCIGYYTTGAEDDCEMVFNVSVPSDIVSANITAKVKMGSDGPVSGINEYVYLSCGGPTDSQRDDNLLAVWMDNSTYRGIESIQTVPVPAACLAYANSDNQLYFDIYARHVDTFIQVYDFNVTYTFTAAELSSGNFTQEQSVWMNVTGSDGLLNATMLQSNTINILNRIGTLTTNISSSGDNKTTDDLTVGYALTDADGDSVVSIETKWYNTSYEITTAVNATILYAGNTTKGQDYKASIRVNDGYNWTLWYNTSTLSVVNTLPVITVNISSSNVGNRTEGDLTCGYSYTDADNDAQAAYETKWYNTSYEITTAVNATILYAGNTTKDQAYKCSLRVNDGEAWSGWSNSSTLTILNSAPSQPTLNAPENASRQIGNSVLLNATCTDDDASDSKYYAFYGDTSVSPSTLLQNTTDSTYTWATTDGNTYYWNAICTDGTAGIESLNSEIDNFERADSEDVNASYTGNFIWYEHPQTENLAYNQEVDVDIKSNMLVLNPTVQYTAPGIANDFSKVKNLTSYGDGNVSITFIYNWTASGTAVYFGFGQNMQHSRIEHNAGQATRDEWFFRQNGNTARNFVVFYFASAANPTMYVQGCSGGTTQTAAYAYSNTVTKLTASFNVATNSSKFWINDNYVGEATGCNKDIFNNLSSVTQVDSFGASIFWNQNSGWLNIINVSVDTPGPSSFVNASSPVSETWTFTENALPTITTNISSDSPLNNTNGNLTGGYSYSDADGDAQAAFETRWYKDNTEQASLKNVTLVYSNYTSFNEIWKFSARVNDGFEWTAWSNSTNLTILNTPPVITVNISSDSPNNNSNGNLTGAFAYSDADGDAQAAFETRWYKDNAEQASLKNVTLVYSNYTSTDEIWKFSARANDGVDWSLWVNSSNLTILNTPPSLHSVNISSTDFNKTSGDLVVGYNATDKESDPISISDVRWYQNGLENVTFINVTRIYSNNFTEGEVWKVGLRVTDGQDVSLWVNSSNLTIVQDYPTIVWNITADYEVAVGSVAHLPFFLNDSSNVLNCSASYEDPETYTHYATNDSVSRGLNYITMNFESRRGFNVSLTCSDVYYYSNTTTIQVVGVGDSSSAIGGGGGAGGGGGGTPTTGQNITEPREGYIGGLDNVTLYKEYNFKGMPLSAKIEFNLDDEVHILHIISIDREKDRAGFTLASTNPFGFYLNTSEIKYFELTNDAFIDVGILLNNITDAGADVTIKIFNPKITVQGLFNFFKGNKFLVWLIFGGLVSYNFYFKNKLKWRRKKSQVKSKIT